MAANYDSLRLRNQRAMDARLTADHRSLAAGIAQLVMRAAGVDGKIADTRASRETLRLAIWEQVLKPYYVGRGTDALDGPRPQSPYALLIVEGIIRATRIQAERQAALVRRLVKDPVVRDWLTGPRPRIPTREMLHITELLAPTRSTVAGLRGVDGRIDVERARATLVKPKGMYDPFHEFVDPNGYRLSDRIWNVSVDVRARIDHLLTYHIANGTSAVDMAKLMEPFLTPGGRLSKTSTPYGREGSYSARRLARTEITAAAGRATVNAATANPFVESVKWRLSASHPKFDVCDGYAHGGPNGDGVYPLGQVPQYPAHPHCLCSLLPVPVGSISDLVADLRKDIQAAKGSLVDAASGGVAKRAKTLEGLLNPEYLTQAMLDGTLEEAVQQAAEQAATLPVRKRYPKKKTVAASAPAPAAPAARGLDFRPDEDSLLRLRENAEYQLMQDTGKTVAELEDTFAELLKDKPIIINIESRNWKSLRKAGRWKTQFETKTSGGMMDTRVRANAERDGLGYPINVDPKQRPVYGWVKVDPNAYSPESYGDISVTLKDSVKDRATITVGDSLGGFLSGAQKGTPFRKPQLEAVGTSGYQSKAFAQYVKYGKPDDLASNVGYVEAQMQGQVTFDDIESVNDKYRSLSQDDLDHLQSLGIRVTFNPR